MTDAEQSYQAGRITLEEGLARQASRPELADYLPVLDTIPEVCMEEGERCAQAHGYIVHLLTPTGPQVGIRTTEFSLN